MGSAARSWWRIGWPPCETRRRSSSSIAACSSSAARTSNSSAAVGCMRGWPLCSRLGLAVALTAADSPPTRSGEFCLREACLSCRCFSQPDWCRACVPCCVQSQETVSNGPVAPQASIHPPPHTRHTHAHPTQHSHTTCTCTPTRSVYTMVVCVVRYTERSARVY